MTHANVTKNYRLRRPRRDPTAQECLTRETNVRKSHCPKRSDQCALVLEPHSEVAVEWIPPPKWWRNADAIYKTTRPVADEEELRKAGRGSPGAHRGAKLLSVYPSLSW